MRDFQKINLHETCFVLQLNSKNFHLFLEFKIM